MSFRRNGKAVRDWSRRWQAAGFDYVRPDGPRCTFQARGERCVLNLGHREPHDLFGVGGVKKC
jgi:hypothetical protein